MNISTMSEPTDSSVISVACPADHPNFPCKNSSWMLPAGTQPPHPAKGKVTSDRRSTRSGRAGFTVMEIMLAVFILAIVITTVLASFDSVFSTTATLDNSAKYYDMAKNCLNRLTLDLESLYVAYPPLFKPPELDSPPDPYRFFGIQSDVAGISFAQLRFTSHAHIPFEKSTRHGIAEIVYYIAAKADGQLVLKRSDRLYPYPPFEERGSDPVLCENVKSLAVKYYDSEGAESGSWDSDSQEYGYATPIAIEIQLELGDESQSYVFATRIQLPVKRDKHG